MLSVFLACSQIEAIEWERTHVIEGVKRSRFLHIEIHNINRFVFYIMNWEREREREFSGQRESFQEIVLAHLSRRFKWAFPIKICPLSVVVVAIGVVVNFSHFLQNHWTNFNQTWVKEIQVCSNEGPCYFPRGDYNEIAKTHWRMLPLPEPLSQFQLNSAQNILGWWGFKFVQKKGPTLFQGGVITK